jgi:hypothetical protein
MSIKKRSDRRRYIKTGGGANDNYDNILKAYTHHFSNSSNIWDQSNKIDSQPAEMILKMMNNMNKKDIHALCKSSKKISMICSANKNYVAKIILKNDFGITNFPKTFEKDFSLSSEKYPYVKFLDFLKNISFDEVDTYLLNIINSSFKNVWFEFFDYILNNYTMSIDYLEKLATLASYEEEYLPFMQSIVEYVNDEILNGVTSTMLGDLQTIIKDTFQNAINNQRLESPSERTYRMADFLFNVIQKESLEIDIYDVYCDALYFGWNKTAEIIRKRYKLKQQHINCFPTFYAQENDYDYDHIDPYLNNFQIPDGMPIE